MAASFWFTNQELITLTMACRRAAKVERDYGAAQESLTVKEHHEAGAKAFEKLADMFEEARKLAEKK